MIIDVETEVNKHKNCKERDKLGAVIREYKNLAMEHATNFSLAGKYNNVALKLQDIYDKLPAPNLKNVTAGTVKKVQTKTSTISKEEKAKINAAWSKKTGG
jgi:uncharacterized protein with gpF-like domain